MLGIAVGRIGMSFDEFCGYYFEEFSAIVEAWREAEEDKAQGEWERMRTLAAICIQPHVKKKITPKQLLPMPWDKKSQIATNEPKLSIEERKERAAKAAKLMRAETI